MNINVFGVNRQRETRAVDNTEDRFELFLLGDGEKKVAEEADTRKWNFSTHQRIVSLHFCLLYIDPHILFMTSSFQVHYSVTAGTFYYFARCPSHFILKVAN